MDWSGNVRKKRIRGCGKHKIATRRCKSCEIRIHIYFSRLKIIEDMKEMSAKINTNGFDNSIEELESCEDLQTI